MKIAGIFLVVLGLVMATFTGFNIITKKKVVDLGAVEITQQQKTPIYWSPVTGGVLIAAGVVVLLLSYRKSTS